MANTQRSWYRVLVITASSILLLGVLTYAFMFSFQLVRTTGNAMEPAVGDEQRLIVDKLTYRFRDPRSGEVVMLYYPIDPNVVLVKRVIGRPGDTIRMIAGTVYVNGKPVSDDVVPPEFRSRDDWGPEVVPTGYYFVLGDRRNGSSDSRHWGFVPRRYIIGKIVA